MSGGAGCTHARGKWTVQSGARLTRLCCSWQGGGMLPSFSIRHAPPNKVQCTADKVEESN